MNAAMPNLMSAIGWTLVHFVWQGALVGCATALALTVLRNARPQMRYLVACGGLLACLAWPAADLFARLASPGLGANAAHLNEGQAIAAAANAAPGLLAWLQDHMPMVVGAWASCSLALAIRMVAGLLWIGRAGQSMPCAPQWQARIDGLATRAGVTRAVRLRVIGGLASPVTAGWWRPVVFVPAALVSGMPPDLLEALLAHEIAHVKRHDYLVNLAQNVVESLLFYHPAVWWISGRIRDEREQIADDLASGQLGEPRRLARALSELEKLQFAGPVLAQAANGGDLLGRIRRLVRPDTQALSWKAALPVLGLALASLAACSNLHSDAASGPAAASAGVPVASTAAVPALHEEPAPSPVAQPAATAQPVVRPPAQVKRSAPPPADHTAQRAPQTDELPAQSTAPANAGTTRAVVNFAACERPRYPAADLEAGHEGAVTLSFLVGTDGNVAQSRVLRSSGYRELDEAARTAIEKCQFKPATAQGVPVETWVPVQYLWSTH
jgi:bla regulator protein blaR1